MRANPDQRNKRYPSWGCVLDNPGVPGVPGSTPGKVRTMKLTVIGGTGLIGAQVGQKATPGGHQAGPAAPPPRRDAGTGKGPGHGPGGARGQLHPADPRTTDAGCLDLFG